MGSTTSPSVVTMRALALSLAGRALGLALGRGVVARTMRVAPSSMRSHCSSSGTARANFTRSLSASRAVISRSFTPRSFTLRRRVSTSSVVLSRPLKS